MIARTPDAAPRPPDPGTGGSRPAPAEARLRARIAGGDARLAVIGLGFVGTPVAALFADAGFGVVGVDRDADKVAALAAGRVPFDGREPGLEALLRRVVAAGRLRATTDYDAVAGTDVALVAVETPVDPATRRPAYGALRGALASLGPRLRRGALVVVESTLSPGTMGTLVAPTLAAASGLAVGDELLLAHCPERVMPGRLLENLRTMSRVVGGTTPEAADAARALYGHVVEADLDPADALTAELVKTGENAYRDVQIAFANEMALICDTLGADVWRVRELLNKSPGRHMLRPGAGVGGHCIPKDPWLLAAAAEARSGFAARLIPAARAINDGMPAHVAGLVVDALGAAGPRAADAAVLVLGWSYREDTDDARGSPSAALVTALEGRVAEVRVHDPWVAAHRGVPVATLASGADALVLMVAHSAYGALDWAALRAVVRTPLLVDGRGAVDADAARAAGWRVRTVGVGRPAPEPGPPHSP